MFSLFCFLFVFSLEGNLDVVHDFTFITGVGKHSKKPFEPVLRPAAQNMLLEEFNPPLETHFAEGNTGCLQVHHVFVETISELSVGQTVSADSYLTV